MPFDERNDSNLTVISSGATIDEADANTPHVSVRLQCESCYHLIDKLLAELVHGISERCAQRDAGQIERWRDCKG